MTVLPGIGLATSLSDLLDNYRQLVAALPALIQAHPTAQVVRNQVGNLSIVVQNPDGSWDNWGYIDTRTGDIEPMDEPWPVEDWHEVPR